MRALVASLILLAGPALAGSGISRSEPPLVLLDHGVICQVTPAGSRPAPDTEQGEINLIDQDRSIDVTTQSVPAALGLSFGVRFTLAEGAGQELMQVVVTHPPMGPRGIERESWTATVSEGDPSLNLFTFEYPYEMVLGTWVMALERDGRRMLEQSFEVVPAQDAPWVLHACEGDAPMS